MKKKKKEKKKKKKNGHYKNKFIKNQHNRFPFERVEDVCPLPGADHRLEGDVRNDKADPLVCLHLDQISVLQYFFETAGEWQLIWCLRRPQIIHDIGSLCINTIWLFNFFVVKRLDF